MNTPRSRVPKPALARAGAVGRRVCGRAPGRLGHLGRLVRLCLALACSALGSLAAVAAPPPGAAWEPIPALSDEFAGAGLDASKWYDHNPDWEGRKPGWFSRGNVALGDGRLRLTARVERRAHFPPGYRDFTTAAVRSRARVKYGYFEVRAKPMAANVSSAFWFSHHTAAQWTEIDVFELCGGGGPKCGNVDHMHVHVFQTPTRSRHWKKGKAWAAPIDLTRAYHLYGLEWSPARIRWYVDGKVVWEVPNTHWHQPLYMYLDAETQPEWFGLPKTADLPSTFSIDYVRAWRRKPAAATDAARPIVGPVDGPTR